MDTGPEQAALNQEHIDNVKILEDNKFNFEYDEEYNLYYNRIIYGFEFGYPMI